MKHIFFLALGLSMACAATAQTTTTGNIRFSSIEGNNCMSIPKAFTYNHKPLLTFRDGTDEWNKASSKINIYDENIDLVKSFDVLDDKKFYYTLSYNVQTRRVKDVNKTVDSREIGTYETLDEWIEEQKRYDANIKNALVIKTLDNGDKMVSVDYSKADMGNNESMYYCYYYFGLQYPRRYWVWSKGIMYQYGANYSVDYTEWEDTGTKNVDKSVALSHLYLCNVDLDNDAAFGCGNHLFDVSQTLFNADDDFEYIIPKCAMSANYPGASMGSVDTSEAWYADRIITEQTSIVPGSKSNVVMTGFQVVSSNGNVVKDLNFENGFEAAIADDDYYAAVITMGGNRYLAFNGWANGKEGTIFFKIDKASTSIKQLKITNATMTLKPNVVNKNATINVMLGDDNDKGSDIIVTSTMGAKIKTVNVPAGQTQTQLSVNAPAGVYCVSRILNGKVNNTKKVLVK